MLQKINILPRWIIFFLDLSITTLAFFVVNLISYRFSLSTVDVANLTMQTAVLLLVNTAVFYLFKTYSGIIRYTGAQDAIRLFKASIVTFISLEMLNLGAQFWNEGTGIRQTIWLTLAYSLTSFGFLISARAILTRCF